MNVKQKYIFVNFHQLIQKNKNFSGKIVHRSQRSIKGHIGQIQNVSCAYIKVFGLVNMCAKVHAFMKKGMIVQPRSSITEIGIWLYYVSN